MNKFSSLFLYLQVKTVQLYPRGIFLFLLVNWLTFSERQQKFLRKRSRTVFFLIKMHITFPDNSSDSHSTLSQTQRPDSVTVCIS